MLTHRIGILRTLPDPEPQALHRLKSIAAPLAVEWAEGADVADVIAGIDRDDPKHVAFLEQAASLLRGAGYTPFDGTVPEHAGHAGVGAPYAHVTAPLRRLVDRFASTLCVALSSGEPVPYWIRTALPLLPGLMQRADRQAHDVDRAVVDATEAWLLQDQVGQSFPATVLGASKDGARILIDEPPVRANCSGAGLVDGQRVTVRLVAADVAARTVRFEAG